MKTPLGRRKTHVKHRNLPLKAAPWSLGEACDCVSCARPQRPRVVGSQKLGGSALGSARGSRLGSAKDGARSDAPQRTRAACGVASERGGGGGAGGATSRTSDAHHIEMM